MAAPAKYPTPPEQLLRLARPARARGLSFDEFWFRAVRPRMPPVTTRWEEEFRPADAIVWPGDTWDRQVWLYAINGSEDGWRRAYEGVPPTPQEQAIAMLSPVFEAIEERRADAERRGVDVNGGAVAITPSRAA